MKIRTDFVTNSSSTSYCILGISIQDEELMEIRNKLKNLPCILELSSRSYETAKQKGFKGNIVDWYCNEDKYYGMVTLLNDLGISIHNPYDDGTNHIGMHLPELLLKDSDKTFNEIKKDISMKLNEYGFETEPNNLEILNEVYYN